jgi:hypothetical protein
MDEVDGGAVVDRYCIGLENADMKIMRSLCYKMKSHPPHSSSRASAMFGFMLGLNLVVYVVKYCERTN